MERGNDPGARWSLGQLSGRGSTRCSATRAGRCFRSTERASFRAERHRHILVRHEQGAAQRRGYAPLDRGGRGSSSHLGAGGDERGDRDDRRSDELDPLVVLTGQVPTLADRQRRLPGGGHRRDHPALHQAQLAGQGARGTRRDHPPGVPARATGGRGRCWSTFRRTSSRDSALRPARRRHRSRTASRGQGGCGGDPGGRRGAGAGGATDLYSGGGVVNSGLRSRLLRGAGRGDRLSDHLDADGARGLPGELQRVGRHARHARPTRPTGRCTNYDFMLCIGARSTTITGRVDAFSPGSLQGARQYRPLLDTTRTSTCRCDRWQTSARCFPRCWRSGRRRSRSGPKWSGSGGGRSSSGGGGTA